MSDEEREINNELVEAVELEVGMGQGAWDCVGAMNIIAAVLKHSPDIAELRTALAASHEREKAERAGRAAAEKLAEARLRTIHELTMRLELEKPKRHAKKN